VHAFGSFITGAPDLGDIDLAFNLEGKQAEIERSVDTVKIRPQ
jgi:hypothetical protein